MKKRIITILLGIILMLTLIGCGNTTTQIIKLQNNETQSQESKSFSRIYVYKTEKSKEYLAFLENFDESNNEIIGITTCMWTGSYSSNNFYMVTYKKRDKPIKTKKTGKVLLFKTQYEDAYCYFLASLDETRYEILGITTSMSTGPNSNGAFYMVTFRELK